jgi:hypothetical protein
MDDGNVEHDALQDTFHGKINPTDVKFSTLERITRNFSKDQIIGEGGFGTVYKVNFSFHTKSCLNKIDICLSGLLSRIDKRAK